MSGLTKCVMFGLSIALVALWSTDAAAYQRYNDGCQVCHGHFTDALSPQGNVFVSDNKHEMHRNGSEMASACNLCHTKGDNKNPYLGSSNGISGKMGNPDAPPLGCCGCHGREEDAGAYNGINLDASPGRGAGLRQHHTRAGWTSCMDCHWDADPANYTPVEETVAPPYYGLTVYTLANNPVNDVQQFQINENWTVGDFVGMDNDGDLVYDAADTGTANASPIAVHGGPYWGLVGIPLAFDGSASVDSDGTIASYDWTFGDSGTGTGANPTHTYASAGTYTVTLTVTDNGGATDVATTDAEIVVSSTAPPVNQFAGMLDQTAGAMTEADCRACHVVPTPPERHHALVGTPIPAGTVAPYPGSDTEYGCFNCHESDFTLGGDCIWCHTANAHHSTADATGGVCTTCHGDIVDDVNDGHYIPTYAPSSVTPRRSNGEGLPLNGNGDGAGACDYCHNDDGLPTSVIETNQNLHHGTGIAQGVDECDLCHDLASGPSGPDTGGQIRICEKCHGLDSLHSIQADSPNANNPGSLVVGGEDLGFGHVGRDAGPGDSDCWGCHGFAMASALASASAAPGTSAIVPTLYGCEPAAMTVGTDTTIVLAGSAFTNTTGTTLYSSNVVLTASDGSSVTLAPNAIDEDTMEVTVAGVTAPGNYTLRAVKTDSAGKTVASNPVSISVLPQVYITEATWEEGVVTITGGSFGGYVAGSGTSVIGAIRAGRDFVTEEATVVSWSDTTIVAGFGSRPTFVAVHSIFGDSAPEVVTGTKPGKGKGKGKGRDD